MKTKAVSIEVKTSVRLINAKQNVVINIHWVSCTVPSTVVEKGCRATKLQIKTNKKQNKCE